MRVIQQVQDRLLACPPEDLAGEHVEVARLLCGEFELSGLGLLEVDTTEGRLCFSWPAAPSSIRLADYPWVVADLRRSEVVRIDVRSLAALSRPTRMELERFKIGSLLLIPRPASELEFALAVAAQQEQTWSTDLIGELRVAGGLLAVSELRRDSHEVAARARERFQSSLTEQGLLDLHERLARAERLGRGSVLVSGAAHDLSNLITPVATYSELALIAKEDDERRELLRNLHRAAYHAQQLCDQLLDFLRGEPPRRSSLNLSDLVRQVVAQQSVSLDPGVRLDLVACVDSAMLRGNAIQLREAVQCLVVNAIQAVQSSGGSVEVRLEEVGSNWQLRVSDDGPGVDPRLADRLCEPFVTSKGSQGTGLGLPLVRTVVAEHGGELSWTSRPGEGATFLLELPALQGPGDSSRVSDVGQLRAGSGEVWLVEDDAGVRELTLTCLQSLGYEGRAFVRGQELLSAFRAECPFLAGVLIDFELPGISGLSVAAELRQCDPELPLVLVSGNTAALTGAEALVDGTLRKPFRLKSLSDIVSRLFSRAA